MRMREFVGKVLFRTIGQWPVFSGREIRALCGKIILAHCGKQVNIHSSAHFSSGLSLGDRSGLGDNNMVYGSVTIGDNVMIGADVKFFSRNHRSTDTTTPMIFQGFAEIRPSALRMMSGSVITLSFFQEYTLARALFWVQAV